MVPEATSGPTPAQTKSPGAWVREQGGEQATSPLISSSHALKSEGKTWGWAPSPHLELVTLGLERRRIQMGPARV